MKKYFLLIFLSVTLLLAAGCGVKEDKPSTFQPSKAELQEAARLPKGYADDTISFKYPADWNTGQLLPGIKFIIAKDNGNSKFRTDIKVFTQESDPAFIKLTAEEVPKTMAQMLKGQVKNLEFIKVEKGSWSGVAAMYMEYKGNILDQDIYWSQYYYDNGKKLYVLTFTTTQQEWPQMQKEARRIFSSVTVKK